MSDTSNLAELARLAGQARTTGPRAGSQRRVLGSSMPLPAKAQRRSVSELLGAVLALSARTRRAMLPRTTIELDVFGPTGGHAVRLKFGDHQ